jgi:hypothetical protein
VKHARVISEWTGIDYASIEKMMKASGSMDSDFSLTSKLNGLIKEEQKKRDELKKKQEEEAQALKIQKVQEGAAMLSTVASEVVVKEELKVEEEVKQEEPVVVTTAISEIEEKQAPKVKIEKVKTEAQLQKEKEEMISVVMELVQEDTA